MPPAQEEMTPNRRSGTDRKAPGRPNVGDDRSTPAGARPERGTCPRRPRRRARAGAACERGASRRLRWTDISIRRPVALRSSYARLDAQSPNARKRDGTHAGRLLRGPVAVAAGSPQLSQSKGGSMQSRSDPVPGRGRGGQDDLPRRPFSERATAWREERGPATRCPRPERESTCSKKSGCCADRSEAAWRGRRS